MSSDLPVSIRKAGVNVRYWTKVPKCTEMQAPSNKPKTDRRWLRSRELLSNAMILLMMEKSYGAITVQDIIERANVGRSTFYAHYQHKDDLLSNEFERLVAALSADMKRSGDGKALMPSLELFRHVQSHYKLY